MNAVESAPSAKRSRNKFGNRNAMRNASRFLSGAEQPGKHHLAHKTEQAARQNGNADHTRRAGAHSPVVSRSHRRMLTTNTRE